jgi:hypothetical protein
MIGWRFAYGAVGVATGLLVGACSEMNAHSIVPLSAFANAPARGPAEASPPSRALPGPSTNPATAPAHWPGRGLAQHSFLYYGEGNNTLFVVDGGKVIWNYTFPKGGEIDDAWMLSNGHIICTVMDHCYEVTPDKRIVWTYDCPAGTQIHTLQPIGLDKVMVVENGLPPHLYVLNKSDNAKLVSHVLPAISATDPKTVHGQFRNCRMTAAGTYLLPFLGQRRVVEYDKEEKEIRTFQADSPWSAVRLRNGNTLIPGDNHAYVHEVAPDGKIVWAIEKDSLPGITLRDVQTADRLANGNTVFCNRGAADKNNRFGVQVVEVTPEKKVVWVLQDWGDLPSATGIQLLDEPGVPETPGELQR